MTPDERLDRLEQRLAVLEGLVRQLIGQGPLARPAPRQETPGGQERRTAEVIPPPRPRAATPQPEQRPKPPAIDSEQWFGQRGLLAVGVIFLILAAGYLLKLSFERGWVSPAARCFGGAIAGLAVGAVGYRLHRKGLSTYGASLIGCGAAIIYLSVWAASRLYQFLPPTSGILGLALVSLTLAAIAFIINVEALGATAALGAFFAPLILGTPTSNPDALLLYLGFMAASLGWVSARQRWRLAMALIGLSYFGFGTTPPFEAADPYRVLVYGLFGGCAGLYVGLRERWWETRVLAFAGGWGLLFLANQRIGSPWPILMGAVILAAPVWARGFRSTRIWPGRREAGSTPDISFAESLYFYLTPWLLGWAVHQLSPEAFAQNKGWVPLLVAVPYLVVGFSAVRIPFALVGTTALLIAAITQWSGLEATWALLLLATLWAASDHLLRRDDGRWYGLFAALAALMHLSTDATTRATTEPAFTGPVALSFWWCTLTLAAFGAGLWRREDVDEKSLARSIPPFCWTIAGIMLLFGVTGEIQRYFEQSTMPQVTATLAQGLATSAWWIVFAAGLILLGFRNGWKTVRVAGLVVSAMAVLKVVLFDLSGLDALYRVGSVLILGIVSLGLAYLYHRRGEA